MCEASEDMACRVGGYGCWSWSARRATSVRRGRAGSGACTSARWAQETGDVECGTNRGQDGALVGHVTPIHPSDSGAERQDAPSMRR